MLNSRIFFTLILILTISSLFLLNLFYKKQEYSNILNTNYGTVNLGKVYSEKVILEIEIQNFLTDDNKYEDIGNFPLLNSVEHIDKKMDDIFDSLNSFDKSKDIISYSEAKPTVEMHLKINTKVEYLSSNFNKEPFIFHISEKDYALKKDENLKKSIKNSVDANLVLVKENVFKSLFITKPEVLGFPINKNN